MDNTSQQSQNSQVPQTPDQMHSSLDTSHNSKIMMFVIAGFILLLVGVGGYVLGTNKSQPIVQNQQNIVVPTTISSPTPDETENWKIYVDPQAKYSFKYPDEWPLSKIPVSRGCDVCLEGVSFSKTYNPNSADSTLAVILVHKELLKNVKTIDDYINSLNERPTNIEIKETTIAGEKAVSYRLSGGIPPLPIIEYVITNDRLWYTIRLEDTKETNKNRDRNIKIFDQILSTFKFTE